MHREKSTLLAYQPIYDRNLDLMGGELLYRSDTGLTALDVGDQYATSELVFNLCTGISEQFEGFNHPLFINVSADFILSEAFLPLEPSKVIIELVERIEPDANFIEAVKGWHKKGFRFALDDFEYSFAWEPLLKYCDIIKVDIESANEASTKKLMKALQHTSVKWLAERVETEKQLEYYKSLGFDLFQGYFLARPQTITGQKISPAAANMGRLIEILFDDDVDVAQLTEVVTSEPALSIKLLKIANSPFYRGHGVITSMQQAIMRLGLEQLRKWVILIASLEGHSTAAVQLVLTRANACSEIARQYLQSSVDADKAFLAALLSGVDILLSVDKKEFLAQLQLPTDIVNAALDYRGSTGAVVKMVLKAEQSVFESHNKLKSDARAPVISAKVIEIYQLQTLRTQQLLESL